MGCLHPSRYSILVRSHIPPSRPTITCVVTSLFELFKIGIGPSSSHTVGPMRAALSFAAGLARSGVLPQVARVQVDLYGSLALTGVGHGTDTAILQGLNGHAPDRITPQEQADAVSLGNTGSLLLAGQRRISFSREHDLRFHRYQMYPDPDSATHPNGMRLTAIDNDGAVLATETYYSIGGGFIVTAEHFSPSEAAVPPASRTVPHPFHNAAELLSVAAARSLTIAELMLQNEVALLNDPIIPRPPLAFTAQNPRVQVTASVLALANVMFACIERGIATEGILPGGLNVRRRAPRLSARLKQLGSSDPLAPLDWVTVFAMAVNEENAAGGRVVTAPTNGAAGVIPAI
ncbi:MAG: L-serine ammonia-lyase, iron-sulfur-dependent, subunit alpha, partial [Terriglobus roseus]|nr:L-serine ammonia-lyase, iron-sulfur-dependent, subunit alpha [Terriglobus roseus]